MSGIEYYDEVLEDEDLINGFLSTSHGIASCSTIGEFGNVKSFIDKMKFEFSILDLCINKVEDYGMVSPNDKFQIIQIMYRISYMIGKLNWNVGDLIVYFSNEYSFYVDRVMKLPDFEGVPMVKNQFMDIIDLPSSQLLN